MRDACLHGRVGSVHPRLSVYYRRSLPCCLTWERHGRTDAGDSRCRRLHHPRGLCRRRECSEAG